MNTLLRIAVINLTLLFSACSHTSLNVVADEPARLNHTPLPESHTPLLAGSPTSPMLWIWIAPEYRADMPEGSGEYLVEPLY